MIAILRGAATACSCDEALELARLVDADLLLARLLACRAVGAPMASRSGCVPASDLTAAGALAARARSPAARAGEARRQALRQQGLADARRAGEAAARAAGGRRRAGVVSRAHDRRVPVQRRPGSSAAPARRGSRPAPAACTASSRLRRIDRPASVAASAAAERVEAVPDALVERLHLGVEAVVRRARAAGRRAPGSRAAASDAARTPPRAQASARVTASRSRPRP